MFRKKFFAFCAVIFVLISLAGCDNWRWQRYSSKEYKFSILLPRFWHKEIGILNTVVMAFAPLDKQAPFQANLNVMVTELPQDVDLSTFFELNKDALASKVAMMNNLLEGDIYAGLLPGKWLSFEGVARNIKVKIITAVWIKARRVYTITGMSEVKTFPKYEPIFNRAFRSLRVR